MKRLEGSVKTKRIKSDIFTIAVEVLMKLHLSDSLDEYNYRKLTRRGKKRYKTGRLRLDLLPERSFMIFVD